MRGAARTIVAGGGIAGIAAALRLADAGVAVTLLETRKKLGGRATSFTDVRTGQVLDNCQHVALRCCRNYLDLLGRLGVAEKISWHAEQFWVERGGRTSVIRPSWLPAPGHFGPSVLGAAFLNMGDVAALGRGMLAILRAERGAWRTRTFGEFLRGAGQPAGLVEKFWEPVVVSACNLPCGRVAASSALHVFQEGFLAHARSAEMGIATVPLLELYDRAEEVIRAAGGEVRLGCSVARVGAREVRLGDGAVLEAEAVVCALPAERAAEVVDPALAAVDPRMEALPRITHSPILGVHMVFDRPVLPTPHAVLVCAGTQWLFRKDAAGRAVHAVISAADDWVELGEQAIVERVRADIEAYFPRSAGAKVVSGRPVKEKRATFAATPEVEGIRPGTCNPEVEPGGEQLYLAGDYTATGWPATMEGATRSGYAAAAAVLGLAERALLAPDLPVARMARLLGLRPAAAGEEPRRAGVLHGGKALEVATA